MLQRKLLKLCRIDVSKHKKAYIYYNKIRVTFPFLINKIYSHYAKMYSILRERLLIYAIGDSHTGIFTRNKSFCVHHLGPATAFNLNNPNSTVQSGNKLFRILKRINKKRDVVILVFGEIDCRLHIYNQYMKKEKKVSISTLIDNTITNYGDVLERVSKMGIKFCILGITPASKQENIYGYPFYGSPEIRSKISREFNEKLKNYCSQKKYSFIDVYPFVADADGFIREEFAADTVHLNDKILPYIVEQLTSEFDIVADI